jgi:MOSC domain-containing protein YiiM
MENQARVISISTSKGGIPKIPINDVVITFAGLKGDGHNHAKHNSPLQAVCLQDFELIQEVSREIPLSFGTIGENLMVRGLNVQRLPLGTVLTFEGGVVLELTKVRMPCYVLDSIDPRLKELLIGRCGMYAKVIREGLLKRGEAIQAAIFSTI